MMILNGIAGLLQILLLPGLIITRICKLRGGLTERLLRLFPLSLLTNYLLVFLLAALGLYKRPVMTGMILLEILLILWLYRKALLRPLNETAAALRTAILEELRPLGDFLREIPGSAGGWIRAVSGCFALSAVLWGLHLCRLNAGTVFSGWDTLFSWNAYAEIWAGGNVPQIGGMYPQLIPANWSVSYLLQGEGAVQFFNTLLPPLFFLMIEVMLFDLGFQRRESGFFFAAVIARYMMKKLMGDQLFDGYMDVPAAAMSLLSLYTFIKAQGRPLAQQRQHLVLGVLFAAEAAITKQSGFAALLIAPLTVMILLRDAAKSLGKKRGFLLITSVLVIVLPWYLHCLLFNTRGAERELIARGIQDFNQIYSIRERLRLALDTLGKYGVCFLLSLIGLSFIPKRFRLILFLMSWPLTLIWAVSYSYDARNLGPVLPIIAISCGLALSGAGQAAMKAADRLRIGKVPVGLILVLFAAAVLIVLIRLIPDSRLEDDQRRLQKTLFGERLNSELLYGVFGETHSGHDIYTDYPAYFLSGYADCCSAADLTDDFQVRGVLEGEKINWLLLPQIMPNNTDPAKALIEQCIEDGKCELLRCSDGYYKSYCLYEIIR